VLEGDVTKFRPAAYAALSLSALVPLERPAASAERFVVVPATQGRDCVDLDSRWGVGAILSWKQKICTSNQVPVWVQTDCSQDFGGNGYWMATSADGLRFSHKAYKADEMGSNIAKWVCLTVGR
jgi:hypothetical protein